MQVGAVEILMGEAEVWEEVSPETRRGLPEIDHDKDKKNLKVEEEEPVLF